MIQKKQKLITHRNNLMSYSFLGTRLPFFKKALLSSPSCIGSLILNPENCEEESHACYLYSKE